MPRHPAETVEDNVLEFPNGDHRDADLTFGGCGDPTCPTGNTLAED